MLMVYNKFYTKTRKNDKIMEINEIKEIDDEIEVIDIIYETIKKFKSINPNNIGFRHDENNNPEYTFEESELSYTKEDSIRERKILIDLLPKTYIINFISFEYIIDFRK